MSEAYIIDAVRTPVGRRRRRLDTVHPATSGRTRSPRAHRAHGAGIDPAVVEDVVFGCVDHGPPAGDVARTCCRAGGRCRKAATCRHLPIDRQCGSSQQAVHFAARR